MNLLIAPFADLVLNVLQAPLWRWSLAVITLLWVWLAGDPYARSRRFFLAAPLVTALAIEIMSALLLSERGGWLPVYVATTEALQRLATPLGVAAMLMAFAFGVMRLFGLVLIIGVAIAAYFADNMPERVGQKFFSMDVMLQAASFLPALIALLLIGYGLGASIARLRENRQREYDDR